MDPRAIAGLALALMVASLSTAARAQPRDGGATPPDTAALGPSGDDEPTHRREGAPRCRSGEIARGQSCVGEEGWGLRSDAPDVAGTLHEPLLLYSEDPAPSMILRTEPLTPLWVSGLHMSVIVHTFGVIWASGYRCTGCGAESSTMAIPLVGGFVWAGLMQTPYTNIAQVLGVPASILQLIGFGLMIAGAIARRGVPEERLAIGAVQLRPDGFAVTW